MDSGSLNILVEAKKEYLSHLYIAMCPAMIEVFEEIYKESVKLSKGKKTLMQYQKLLKEVLNWNENMIIQNSNKITNSCNWFNDLLAAVFVSTVKILSSVRLNADKNKISIKLPNNKVFIHNCFIAASKDLYKNPYIYYDNNVEQERDMELTKRFSKCIDDTVKEMIPVQEILKSCISQANKESIDIENSDLEEEEDPDEMEAEEEVEEEEEEVAEEKEKPADQQPEPEVKPEVEPPSEIKSIDLGHSKRVEKDDEEDVLFGDAPEESQKRK